MENDHIKFSQGYLNYNSVICVSNKKLILLFRDSRIVLTASKINSSKPPLNGVNGSTVNIVNGVNGSTVNIVNGVNGSTVNIVNGVNGSTVNIVNGVNGSTVNIARLK